MTICYEMIAGPMLSLHRHPVAATTQAAVALSAVRKDNLWLRVPPGNGVPRRASS